MPLTRFELDRMPCHTPGCTHATCTMFLHGRCHIGGGVTAEYNKHTGNLHICCAKCKRPVAVIAVAAQQENFFQ